MTNLIRLYHTVRHLKAIQWYGRARAKLYSPPPDLRPAPPVRTPTGPWRLVARREPSLVGANRCRFLNEEQAIDSAEAWNDPARTKLWLYNLHYFEDLSARDSHLRQRWQSALVERWVAENPPAVGVGWEPFPTSLRIVQWIKWSLSERRLAEPILPPAAVQSLVVQARHLSRKVEYHLLGNHLLANAKALIFAGAFFSGEEADGWRRQGLKILAEQLPAQILADGGHFELSPMYHSLVLEDLLDLHNLAGTYGREIGELSARCGEALAGRIQNMRRWLGAMSHPDGEISLFNDAAMGIAPSPAELAAYAARLQLPGVGPPGAGVTYLADSGYVRCQTPEAVLLIDAARVGPDYLPGHAHADTLSFELSLFGQRTIVDCGVSQYGVSAQRLAERGTAAHNTVVVDGEDSSEVWSGFRVARRAYPTLVRIEEASRGGMTITAEHDGYRRLKGKVLHHRCWRLAERRLEIEDTLSGKWRSAVGLFRLHPAVAVEADGDGSADPMRLLVAGRGMTFVARGAVWKVEDAQYHPEFGLNWPCKCIEAMPSHGEWTSTFGW